jgi:radical SAM protein with 4Fe4S-binding SPASM domain
LNLLHNNYYKALYKSVEPGNKIKEHCRRLCFKLLNFYRGKYRTIKIHLTNMCNLKCKGCYCQFEEKSSLEKTEIFSLLGELKNLGYKNIEFHILGGEPLLRSDLLEIISYAKNRINLKQIVLFTNGTLITEDLAYKMRQSGLDVAIVTLHSHLDKIHDAISQFTGSWDKTVSGIKYLINAGIRTYSFTILMACNIHYLRQIESLVRGLGAKTMYFPFIKQTENDGMAIENKEEFQKGIEWIFNKSKKHKRKISKILLRRGKSCSAFVDCISIKSDGTVTPCPLLNLRLGNIKEEKIYSILNRSYNNKELLNFLSIPQECKGCSLVSVCGGGCKAFRYNFYHDTESKDYNCLGPYKERISPEELGSCLPYVL